MSWSLVRRWVGAPPAVAASLLVVVLAVGVVTIEGFASSFSLVSMLVLSAFLGIAAAGQSMVMLLGGIDLSIPFVIGFANIAAAELSMAGIPFGVVALLVLGASAGIGAVNGAISARLRVHPLIVTLGMGTLVLGAIQVWNRGLTSGSAPAWVGEFVSPTSTVGPLPLPPIVLFWGLLAAAILVVLRRTVYGRSVYAFGANPEAARYCLISPVRLWTVTFAVSGLLAGLAGMLLLGFTGGALGTVGEPYLFLTVAAVVVGGTSLLGGRGGYGGTIIGAVLLTTLSAILLGSGLSGSVRQVAVGIIILVVVAAYGRQPSIRTQI